MKGWMDMFVANRMTKNPITVTPSTKVDEAESLMKKHKFRRLPVVENGKLVGFLSDKDLLQVMPSAATTLAKYEITSLLSKIEVKEIMTKDVITVDEDATIEEAALIMCNKKISGLPVISSVGAVVGVITETDIFKALVDVMGLPEGTTRLTLEVDNKVGVVEGIAKVIAAEGLSIDSLVTCKENNGKYEIVVRGKFPDGAGLKKKLEESGYNVIHTVKIG